MMNRGREPSPGCLIMLAAVAAASWVAAVWWTAAQVSALLF